MKMSEIIDRMAGATISDQVWSGIQPPTLKEAMRAYHGSSKPDAAFEPQHTGHNEHTFGSYHSTRHGIFFSNSRRYAALYGHVGQYRLNVHHTLDLENDNNFIWNFVNNFDPHSDDRTIWLEAREIMYRSRYWQLFEDEVGERFVAYLQDHGYDSAGAGTMRMRELIDSVTWRMLSEASVMICSAAMPE